ncbi:hypothetical protein BSKO_11518 [Bryopsis sp. KO-2023]|nr:hypothetical protein BSKO_11518 [Bryopsis sp. KO-2023]
MCDFLLGCFESLREAAVRGLLFVLAKARLSGDAVLGFNFENDENDEGTSASLTQSTDFPPLDGASTSLFDDFQSIDGIPAFLFEEKESDGKNGASHITCTKFSSDCSKIASGHSNGLIQVWDTQHGTLSAKKVMHSCWVADISFRESSTRWIVSCDSMGKCYLWDWTSPDEPLVFNFREEWGADEILRPSIWDSGTRVVFPVTSVGDVRPSSGLFGDSSSEGFGGGEMLLNVHIFSTPSPAQHDAKGSVGHVTMNWHKDMVITSLQLSPGGTGLIVGSMDAIIRVGGSTVFPDITRPTYCLENLEGVLAKWSWEGDIFVTWNPPGDVLLGQYRVGITCAWSLADIRMHLDRLQGSSGDPSRGNLTEPVVQAVVLENPKSAQTGNCEFVQGDHGRVLACASADYDLKVVFWDVSTWTVIHVTRTGVRLQSTSLSKKSAWEARWVDGKSVRGLQGFHATQDGTMLGTAAGDPNLKSTAPTWPGDSRIIIWDAKHRVQMLSLKLSPKTMASLGSKIDIMFGTNPGQFAVIGEHAILTMIPRPPCPNPMYGAQAAFLEYGDSRTIDVNQKAICKFSLSGRQLGLLHECSRSMHVWDLDMGNTNVLSVEDSGVKFSNFAFSNDGRVLAVCYSDGSLGVWDILESGPQLRETVASIRVGPAEGSPCEKMAIVSENSTCLQIVTYDSTNTLTWVSITWIGMGSDSQNRGAKSMMPRLWSSAGSKPQKSRIEGKVDHVDVDRQEAFGDYSCKFSCDGSKGLLMPDPQTVSVWDLVHKNVVSTVTYKVNLGPVDPGKYCGNVAFSGDFVVLGKSTSGTNEFVIAREGSTAEELGFQLASVPKNMILTEDGAWMLADVFEKVSDGQLMRRQTTLTTEWTSSITQIQLTLSHVTGNHRSRILSGPNLNPSKGLAISQDGRRVACMSGRGKLMVWSTYAADGLLPDYGSLKVKGILDDREKAKRVIATHGASALNYPEPSGMSLLMNAIDHHNLDMVNMMFAYALQKDIKVRLRDIGGGGFRGKVVFPAYSNALDLAVETRSPDTARQIIKAMLAGVVHELTMADVFKDSLLSLTKSYRGIATDVLESEKAMVDLGEVKIDESAFQDTKMLITTHDSMLLPPDGLQTMWTKLVKKQCRNFRHHKETFKIPCISRVIPFADAAQIGAKGTIRRLLVSDGPISTFASPPLKAVISYKWACYGQHLVFAELVHYGILVACFTIYALLLGEAGDWVGPGELARENRTLILMGFLGVSAFLGFVNLCREIRQLFMFSRDNGWKGVVYWIGSEWNWLELVSYALLAIFIPWFTVMGDSVDKDGSAVARANGLLSTLVAIESILLWWKMMYYVKPFRRTGPMVISISEILRDICYFLFLGFMVVIGFTIAFFVLYRRARPRPSRVHPIPPDFESLMRGLGAPKPPKVDEDLREEIRFRFGTIGKTMMSLFAFMLGDFDISVIYGAPNSRTAIFLFLMYMAAMAIVLLNLLIAIMGDSYERVKNSEETQFLRARAIAIDDAESMMSSFRTRMIGAEIKTFVHVLVPKQATEDEGDDWKGKINNLQRRFRHEIQEALKGSNAQSKIVMEKLTKMEEDMEKIKKGLADSGVQLPPSASVETQPTSQSLPPRRERAVPSMVSFDERFDEFGYFGLD